MKNRDLTKDEINKITELCKIREQAFFTIMRQSGLTPNTIKKLKIKNLEKILEPNTPIPCKINIPNELEKNKIKKPPTFIGEEAINYLKEYLKTDRKNLTPESLLFSLHTNPNKEINTKDVSREFKQSVQKLKKDKKITYEDKKGKPSELRLYRLIKFYQKTAKPYLKEIKNNPNKDNEFYRNLYKEKVIRPLEIQIPTTTELKKRIEKMEKIIDLQTFQIEMFSQVEYQRTVNLMSKPPEEQVKEMTLTPEAFQKIRIEDPKTYKKSSLRLLELNYELWSKLTEEQRKQWFTDEQWNRMKNAIDKMNRASKWIENNPNSEEAKQEQEAEAKQEQIAKEFF